jgi:4-diphosphocytidyl-2-C-methyl-D-erythritol kinase
LHFVIARPDVGLSTAEVYRRCQAAAHPQSASALLTALRSGDLRGAQRLMINRLQAPATEAAPVLGELANQFASLGPIAHQLSGSGSAYFGWFTQAKAARRAAATLRGRGWPRTWYAQAI